MKLHTILFAMGSVMICSWAGITLLAPELSKTSSPTVRKHVDPSARTKPSIASDHSNSERVVKLSRDADDKDIRMLKNEISTIKADLAALRRELATTRVHDSETHNLSDVPAESQAFELSEPVSTERETAAIAEEEAEIIREQVERRISGIEDLDAIFSSETTDSSWSTRMSNLIDNALYEKELADISVLGVQCKSTLCRVEVEHDSLEKADEFALWFDHYVSDPLHHVATDHIDGEDGYRVTIVYLAREGYELAGN